jgi:hypothetical protein
MQKQSRFLCVFTFVTTVILGVPACAPKPQTIPHDVTIPVAGPRGGDVDLQLDGKQAIAPLSWSNEVSSDVVFRMTENLFNIRESLSDSQKTSWAQEFLNDLPARPTKLVDSAYTSIFIFQAQAMAKTALDKIIPQLEGTTAKVRQILRSLPPPIREGERIGLEDATKRLFTYLRSVNSAIGRSSLLKPVIAGIHREISKMLTLEPKASSAIRSIMAAKTITKALNDVELVAKEFGIKIPSATIGKMKRGRQLASSVESIRDARSALVTLIDVWSYMTPADRLQHFKAASTDLYDYLNEQSAEDLACMKSPDCMSISQWIARTLFIQPKIEEYGIDRIRATLNLRGADTVRENVAEAVASEIRTVPQTMGDRVEKGVNSEIAPILALKSNFPKALRERLDKWAARRIESQRPAVTNVQFEKARLSIDPSGRMKLKWTGVRDENFDTRAAFDALAPILWQTPGVDPVVARGVALTEINELARRYQKPAESPVAAKNLTARAYAEQVRGLANLALAFREWVPSSFDNLLGTVVAKDLFPEFNVSDLDQSIFPKGAFYALSFQSLSGILRSAKSERTQVFMVDTNKRVIRANQEEIPGGAPTVMAGIADRIGNDLGPTVRAEDVARYLLAVSEVYTATDGVERSTSEILTKPGPDGTIARDEIISSREQIKILILGLANYLSHQFRSGGELVRHELDLATQKPTPGAIAVIDQALAIRALVVASDILGNELYYWEAADLVSSINRLMYRSDIGFYALKGEKSVSPAVLLEMLRALDAVQPHLSEFSRQQLTNLTLPWRRQIATWRLE